MVARTFRTKFTLECYYSGYDGRVDRAIEKAARIAAIGTGFAFGLDLRDLGFEYKTEKQALSAAKRVRAAVGKLRPRVRVRMMLSGTWRI